VHNAVIVQKCVLFMIIGPILHEHVSISVTLYCVCKCGGLWEEGYKSKWT